MHSQCLFDNWHAPDTIEARNPSHSVLVYAVNSTNFPKSNEQRRPSGWIAIACFVLAVVTLGSTNQLQAAGCHLPSASQSQQVSRQLDAALVGKWQYVGGKVFYQFHLAPVRCDGPGCRQAPEPETEMAVIPNSLERSTVPAYDPSPAWQLGPRPRATWVNEDQFASSPALSGMLRPPCCA